MRTIVITGGTDGIGRELALQLIRSGEHIIIIGRSSEKGDDLRLEAARLDGEDRCLFLQADLSIVSENIRIVKVCIIQSWSRSNKRCDGSIR